MNQIHKQLIEFLGKEKYFKFLETFHNSCLRENRFMYWQEQILISFYDKYKINDISFENWVRILPEKKVKVEEPLEYNIVDIWFCNFASEKKLYNYLKEDYRKEDKPISMFAKDQNEIFYDHDFLGYHYLGQKTNSIETLLKNCSWSFTFQQLVQEKLNKQSESFNSVIYVFGNEIGVPQTIKKPDRHLFYVGKFPVNHT